MNLTPLFDLINRLQLDGYLRALDVALARYLTEETHEQNPLILLAIALVSESQGRGDVCLDLHERLSQLQRVYIQQPFWQAVQAYEKENWWYALTHSAAMTHDPALKHAPIVITGDGTRPILYLRRFWSYEKRIQQAIQTRLNTPLVIDEEQLRSLLQQLFQQSTQNAGTDWQMIACALASRSAFAVITGGPGTGKTTTVVRLLALLQAMQIHHQQPTLRIALAAPTGKAAARLNASISAQVSTLPFERLCEQEAQRQQLKIAIPTQVTTLHRLLGPRMHSRLFRHHAKNRLPFDLVVIDEASMMDMELMAALIDALPDSARLILLGDKDQLSSVEAGSILGDFCAQAAQGHYTPPTQQWIFSVTGTTLETQFLDDQGRAIDQVITMLRYSHRFSQTGGIGELARRVNQSCDNPKALQSRYHQIGRLLQHNQDSSVRGLLLTNSTDSSMLDLIRQGYSHYLHCLQSKRPPQNATREEVDAWAYQVLTAYSEFQLLCVVKEGEWGVNQINTQVETTLMAAGLLQKTNQSPWYEGRPIMMTRNDAQLDLMNGDIGIVLSTPELRVAFPHQEGREGVRWFLPVKLQSAETVFAMTVHKSQGSEFTHTALVLPDKIVPVLTRELLYTAITRSKHYFTLIHSNEQVLYKALESQVQRLGGQLV